MERLKRIKDGTEFNHFHMPETGKFALAFNLKQDDFDWLIEQAEKVERMEWALNVLKNRTNGWIEFSQFHYIAKQG
jgi:hypothetical protein